MKHPLNVFGERFGFTRMRLHSHGIQGRQLLALQLDADGRGPLVVTQRVPFSASEERQGARGGPRCLRSPGPRAACGLSAPNTGVCQPKTGVLRRGVSHAAGAGGRVLLNAASSELPEVSGAGPSELPEVSRAEFSRRLSHRETSEQETWGPGSIRPRPSLHKIPGKALGRSGRKMPRGRAAPVTGSAARLPAPRGEGAPHDCALSAP